MIRILVFILAFIPVSVFAEPFSFPTSNLPVGPRVKISVLVDRDFAYPGGYFKLYLSVQIEEGWHIYSLQPMEGNELLATQIKLEDDVFANQKNWQESPTHLIQDDAQQKMVKGHINTAEFNKSFHVPQSFDPGDYLIKGEVIYKACDNSLCTLPQSLPFSSRVHVKQDS